MPSGYFGNGKRFSKVLHKWVNVERTKAFDYDDVDQDSAAFIISFFRAYPDIMADIFRSPNAEYKIELPHRIIMRLISRNRDVFITGCRGIGKTQYLLLTCCICGILYPGEVMRYCAPNQKQAAALATQAFHQIEKDYPDIASQWQIRNDRSDMFRITTRYGSEFSMYAPRGSNASQCIGEEIGAEGADGFDMETFEKDVLPTVRLARTVNQKRDPTHINFKHSYITNACSKLNRAYTVHRHKALAAMLYGDRHEGYVLDIPWEVAVLCNIRDIDYIKDQRNKLSQENFMREMSARYTGTSENPIVSDEVLSRSRKLMAMEDFHNGDEETVYIVSHDVSYEDGAKNAKCADVVLKLTRYTSQTRRDKYKKQCVYVDAYPPPATAYLQAQKVKSLWQKYCKNGAGATYLVIDAQAYGREVVEELMKPTKDGTKPLCCYKHKRYVELEQEGALPVLYPLKAGTRGTEDAEGDMLQYAQVEFQQGNVDLLTSAASDGIEQYKRKHGIKDDFADGKIGYPYRKTDELCQQIQNLVLKTSGLTLKEERRSKSIQRDMWSALKYALRFAQILEAELVKTNYKRKSSYSDAISAIEQNGGFADDYGVAAGVSDRIPIAVDRARLIAMRRR